MVSWHFESDAIGYIINPLQPNLTNDEIIENLANSCATIDEFLHEIQGFSGRFVLLFNNKYSFIMTGDACHLRQMYFGTIEGNFVITSSIKLFLDYFNLELEMNNKKRELLNHPSYIQKEGAWYGDESLDDRLNKLLPNHYLDLLSKEIKRIPLFPSQKFSNEDQIIEYAATIFNGTFTSLTQRYDYIIQSLTSGWDSRILLAASKKFKENIQFYVFNISSGVSSDVWVPKKLSEKLGFNFNIIEPEELRDDFLSVYEKEHIFPRILPNTHNIQYLYDQYYENDVINVNGCATEIVRSFYGYTKGKVSLDMLLTFTGYFNTSPYVSEQIEKWYKNSYQFAQDAGIPLLDLFYWEQRMGNWGSIGPLELDIAMEEISPFNNKNLLLSLLQVDPKMRTSPNFPFFYKLIGHLWKDVLSEPFNPDENYFQHVIKANAMMKYLLLKIYHLKQ